MGRYLEIAAEVLAELAPDRRSPAGAASPPASFPGEVKEEEFRTRTSRRTTLTTKTTEPLQGLLHSERADVTCICCKGMRFWTSIHGQVVCWACHPPASMELVDGQAGNV